MEISKETANEDLKRIGVLDIPASHEANEPEEECEACMIEIPKNKQETKLDKWLQKFAH